MLARIYLPGKTAMQSGTAKAKDWVLEYELEEPRQVEPLMGWTSSGDMKQEVRLTFASKEEAIAFCHRQGIPYRVFDETDRPPRRGLSYADNFAFNRRVAWTH
jgi:NADH dehydrogenase ubiquinone Fe-S protein 4